MVLYMLNWASLQGKDYRTYSENKEEWLNGSHLAWKLLSTLYWRKDIRKDRSERKMGKKTSASTGWSYRRRRVPEIERGSASSHCVENCEKRLWTCRKADYGLIDFTILIHFWEFAKNGDTLAWVTHYCNCFCFYQYIFYFTWFKEIRLPARRPTSAEVARTKYISCRAGIL